MTAVASTAAAPSDIGRIRGRRAITDRLATAAMYSAFLVAVVPLGAVIWYTVGRGLTHFSYRFLTHSMAGVGPLDAGGGIYHAIAGTVETAQPPNAR